MDVRVCMTEERERERDRERDRERERLKCSITTSCEQK